MSQIISWLNTSHRCRCGDPSSRRRNAQNPSAGLGDRTFSRLSGSGGAPPVHGVDQRRLLVPRMRHEQRRVRQAIRVILFRRHAHLPPFIATGEDRRLLTGTLRRINIVATLRTNPIPSPSPFAGARFVTPPQNGSSKKRKKSEPDAVCRLRNKQELKSNIRRLRELRKRGENVTKEMQKVRLLHCRPFFV